MCPNNALYVIPIFIHSQSKPTFPSLSPYKNDDCWTIVCCEKKQRQHGTYVIVRSTKIILICLRMKHIYSNYPKGMKKTLCSSRCEKMCMRLLKGISEKERHNLKEYIKESFIVQESNKDVPNHEMTTTHKQGSGQ